MESGSDAAGHAEPTSPRNVAADAIVCVIVLAGAVAVETIKDFIPKGVPLVVTLTLGVIEATMLVYFLVALVRAVGYAFTEAEKVRDSVGGTRLWQSGKSRLRLLLSALRDSLPTAADVGRTLRYAVRFALALVAVGVLLIALAIFADDSDLREVSRGQEQKVAVAGEGVSAPRRAAETPPGEPSPKQDAAAGAAQEPPAAASSLTDKAPPAGKPSDAERRAAEEETREWMQRQIKMLDERIKRLQEQRETMRRMLDEQPTGLPQGPVESDEPYGHGTHVTPEPRFHGHDEQSDVAQAQIGPPFDPNAPPTTVTSVAAAFGEGFHHYRWHVIGAGLLAAFGTLLVSLFTQAAGKSARRQ